MRVSLTLLVLAAVGISRPVFATTGTCSPLPQAADSIRIIAPDTSSAASTPAEIVIAVKPPGEDVTVTQTFSAYAVVGSDRVPLWLTVPVRLTDPASGIRERLTPGERAWSFRVTGAPRHAAVTIFASHYAYGATDDTPSQLCRMPVKRPIGGFTTG